MSRLQRRIVDLFNESDKPLTALELQQALYVVGDKISRHRVFDVLRRLREDGAIDRIELIKAYVLRKNGQTIYLVCSACHAVRELHHAEIATAVTKLAKQWLAVTRETVVEIAGVCQTCAADEAAATPGFSSYVWNSARVVKGRRRSERTRRSGKQGPGKH